MRNEPLKRPRAQFVSEQQVEDHHSEGVQVGLRRVQLHSKIQRIDGESAALQIRKDIFTCAAIHALDLDVEHVRKAEVAQ
jgi:hypothetical protein